jgi:predicted NUDIX family phosphoesterase
MKSEQVYVVDRVTLHKHGFINHGFHTDNLQNLHKLIISNGHFIDRPKAEENPELKQIIPYSIITRGDKSILLVRRLSMQNEKRLHGKYSVGIGGHINPSVGATSKDPITLGLEQELNEELEISGPINYSIVGYINDDSNLVGQVHFGLVHKVIVLPETSIAIREKDLMEGRFVSQQELTSFAQQMETWSQFLVQALDEIL